MPRAPRSRPEPKSARPRRPAGARAPRKAGPASTGRATESESATSPAPARLISPSRIARYYFHECRRYLRYSSTPKEAWEAEGVPAPPYDHSPVTAAILEGGYTWEEEVVRSRLAGRVHLADARPGTPLKDRIHSADATRRLIAALEPGESIYQPTLITPPGFYEQYGLDSSIVQMADCRPDLITCDDSPEGPVLRVVDIKASPGLKLSHRIQATLYSLILRHVLADWCRGDLRVDDHAAIWLAQADAPALFDTRAIRPPLEDFLEREVQGLLERPADQAPWHVYYRCEWCPYFDHCRAEMATTDDISRVPYLSGYAKQFLHVLEPPVRTLADLEGLLDDPARRPSLDDCASLRGRSDRLRLQVESMRTGDVRVHPGATLAMPRGENVRLVITIQTEPVSGQVYAYGILAQGLKDVLGENPRPMVEVARSPHPECSAELERQLRPALYGVLRPLHDHNVRDGEWKAQKSLQAYTFDTYERDRLSEVLMRRLDDPEVAEEALQAFFHFQRPELIQARNQPADEAVFPVVVLVDVLRDRVALPLDVSYRLADAVRLLMPTQFGFAYTDNDYYAFPLSNQMRLRRHLRRLAPGQGRVRRADRARGPQPADGHQQPGQWHPRAPGRGRAHAGRLAPEVPPALGLRPPPADPVAAGLRGPARVGPRLPGHPRASDGTAGRAAARRRDPATHPPRRRPLPRGFLAARQSSRDRLVPQPHPHRGVRGRRRRPAELRRLRLEGPGLSAGPPHGLGRCRRHRGARRGPGRRAPPRAEDGTGLPHAPAGNGLFARAAVHRLQRRPRPEATRRARPPAGLPVRRPDRAAAGGGAAVVGGAVDPQGRARAGAAARHDSQPARGVRGDRRARSPPGLGAARHRQDPLPGDGRALPGRGPPRRPQVVPNPADGLHPCGHRQRAAQGGRAPAGPSDRPRRVPHPQARRDPAGRHGRRGGYAGQGRQGRLALGRRRARVALRRHRVEDPPGRGRGSRRPRRHRRGVAAPRPRGVDRAGRPEADDPPADRGRRQAASADLAGHLSRPPARPTGVARLAVRVPQASGPRGPVHRDPARELADEPHALHLPGRAGLHARLHQRHARGRRAGCVWPGPHRATIWPTPWSIPITRW